MAEPARSETATSAQALAEMDSRRTMVVDDVSVTYRVYEDRRPRVGDWFAQRGKPRPYREIEAVRGVSLTAHAGEAIGVIGRNGSGKSTLLKALAGLLPVNKGAVYARSEPSLLGVGAVLQPNISGRRNIMLGGLALGLSKKEVEDKVDDITAFAGLEDFIDLPMRTYSSGMRARLHFAIATSVVPEILLIDEALAVGDEIFKKRSEQRIKELRDAAGTVFLVSHALDTILDACTRCLWMDAGKVLADGDTEEVVADYRKYMAKESARERRKGSS